jgi:hypothetical protein
MTKTTLNVRCQWCSLHTMNEYNSPPFATMFQRALLNTCITTHTFNIGVLCLVFYYVICANLHILHDSGFWQSVRTELDCIFKYGKCMLAHTSAVCNACHFKPVHRITAVQISVCVWAVSLNFSTKFYSYFKHNVWNWICGACLCTDVCTLELSSPCYALFMNCSMYWRVPIQNAHSLFIVKN